MIPRVHIRNSGVVILLAAASMMTFRLSTGALSGERRHMPDGSCSFETPEGYTHREMEDGTVELRAAGMLAFYNPVIRIAVQDDETAFDNYDERLDLINQQRFRRHPSKRLLKRNDIRNSHGIRGWEITYYKSIERGDYPDLPLVVVFFLLSLDSDRMLAVEGRAHYDSRTDFILLCDRFINSIAP